MDARARDQDIATLLDLNILDPVPMLAIRLDHGILRRHSLVIYANAAIAEAGRKDGSTIVEFDRERRRAAVGLSRNVLRKTRASNRKERVTEEKEGNVQHEAAPGGHPRSEHKSYRPRYRDDRPAGSSQ